MDPTIVTGVISLAGIGATFAAPLLRDRHDREIRREARDHDEDLARRALLDAAADRLAAARALASTNINFEEVSADEVNAWRADLVGRAEDLMAMQIKVEMRFGEESAVALAYSRALIALRVVQSSFSQPRDARAQQRNAGREQLMAATGEFAQAARAAVHRSR